MSEFRLTLFWLSVSDLRVEVVFIRMGQRCYNLQEMQFTRWVCVARFCGGAGVASVGSFPEFQFTPCPTEPVSASSKMDPPLAKAEPIINAGSTSGIMDLRRGEREYCTTASGTGERIWEKQFCWRPKAQWGRRGRRCSTCKRIPCSLWGNCSPAAMEVQRADSPAAHGELHADGCPKERCDPGAGSQQGL